MTTTGTWRVRLAAWWHRAVRVVMATRDVDMSALDRRLLARRASRPTKSNLEHADASLSAGLDRLLAAKQQNDAKAALIIPAIGAVGGLVISRVEADRSCLTSLLGGIAIVFAAIAVLYAIAASWASDYAIGPDPVEVATHTSGTDDRAFHQALIDALAKAVADTSALVSTKGTRVNRALAASGLAVLALLGFIATGGWK